MILCVNLRKKNHRLLRDEGAEEGKGVERGRKEREKREGEKERGRRI